MIDVMLVVLAFVAFVTGALILVSHKWDFDILRIHKENMGLIYATVCLSTAASFGALTTFFGEGATYSQVQDIAITINRILGLMSVIGFHVLTGRILKER